MNIASLLSKASHQHIQSLTRAFAGHYRKVPKFSDTRKLCCNLPKILIKRQILLLFWPKDANGIANSEYSDQTAPQGAV